ncbi:MAG TPA: type II toxin-antitoxin system PemK/MazF family toxin [Thermoanaerobaculia bacterium]|nr:type II toxin-antitoxin system PemK/MazF family toxin [Thermoanaerobaculia bacterium]
MIRGDFYRVRHPSELDPRRSRVFVIVSRQLLVDSRFSSVVCAPIYTRRDGLHSQVPVGIEEGLKHDSSIHCDDLVSLPKSALTDYVGCLSQTKLLELDRALAFALGLKGLLVN